MTTYNKTQLNPEKQVLERLYFHRDQVAHLLRWMHVVNKLRRGQRWKEARVLDWGCGSANLLMTLYTNKVKPAFYLGLDIRPQMTKANREKTHNWKGEHQFIVDDLVQMTGYYGQGWDIITCFEVIEHIGKHNAQRFVDNLWRHCSADTEVLLSTPVFDPKVGAAQNHIIDGEIGEFNYGELAEVLLERFEIVDVFGTFASQKDYKETIANDYRQTVMERLNELYGPDIVSVVMAPFVPANECRNALWTLKAKEIHEPGLGEISRAKEALGKHVQLEIEGT